MITQELIHKTPCLSAGKLEEMPEEFSIDQFIDHLSLNQKIERGLEQSGNNKVVSHEDAVKKIESWLNYQA